MATINIDVDADGNVNPEWVILNKENDDVAVWICDDRDSNLFIEFKSKDQPFELTTKTGRKGRWRVLCQERMCFSRNIHARATGGGKEYKYWQVLEDKDGNLLKEVDGRIIIRP